MNGRKVEDGGILYDENETEEDDELQESALEGAVARAVATPGMDWNEGGDVPEGIIGATLIEFFVKRLPNSPGVYRMFNADGDVLYVGKARSLKKRVTNYAQGRGHSNRITQMIRQTANMEFVTTRTETEALLLEANLIKRLRPRFNVLLRDDKSFPYILVTGDTRSHRRSSSTGVRRSRKGDYFGPFASAGAVGRTINSLQRAFLLRTCTDSVFESRTRPCLLYQIKRCSGPCTHEIRDADYGELVQEAKDFLSGKSQKVKAHMAEAMNDAAENLDFERAAVYRDRLTALSHVQSHQGINPAGVEEADIFAIHHEGGVSCIQVFFFRTGQNWGNRAYFPKADPQLTRAEVLNAFLAQFYDDKPCPRQILLSETVEEQDLLSTALSERRATRFRSPCRSAARRRISSTMWCANAREAHGRKLAETASQSRLLEGFAATFSCPPRRAASRSTTTRTSWAPTLSAAWWWRGRKVS
jgi:excinuclease ABC subunit C